MRFATGEVTDRQTDRQKDRHTDGSDFIICPMLCYSNGTDKNHTICVSVVNVGPTAVKCLTAK